MARLPSPQISRTPSPQSPPRASASGRFRPSSSTAGSLRRARALPRRASPPDRGDRAPPRRRARVAETHVARRSPRPSSRRRARLARLAARPRAARRARRLPRSGWTQSPRETTTRAPPNAVVVDCEVGRPAASSASSSSRPRVPAAAGEARRQGRPPRRAKPKGIVVAQAPKAEQVRRRRGRPSRSSSRTARRASCVPKRRRPRRCGRRAPAADAEGLRHAEADGGAGARPARSSPQAPKPAPARRRARRCLSRSRRARPRVAVPDVIGHSQQDAVSRPAGRGLNANVVPGRVVAAERHRRRAEPGGRQKVQQGASVRINVASGRRAADDDDDRATRRRRRRHADDDAVRRPATTTAACASRRRAEDRRRAGSRSSCSTSPRRARRRRRRELERRQPREAASLGRRAPQPSTTVPDTTGEDSATRRAT